MSATKSRGAFDPGPVRIASAGKGTKAKYRFQGVRLPHQMVKALKSHVGVCYYCKESKVVFAPRCHEFMGFELHTPKLRAQFKASTETMPGYCGKCFEERMEQWMYGGWDYDDVISREWSD